MSKLLNNVIEGRAPSTPPPNRTQDIQSVPEKLLTYRAAAEALGIPYYKIQRAARAGLLRTYRLLNGRRLVKLSEVMFVIDASREWGWS